MHRDSAYQSISVVLPTYRRPQMLSRCLAALCNQTTPPLEICVGRRVNDLESAAVLTEFIHRSNHVVREAIVPDNGNLVASLNAALDMTTGNLVALTDDDAEAPCDWLEHFTPYFSVPEVGAVGGLDIQPPNPGQENTVGKLQWFGRVTGNHHLGFGAAREVDLLKGVNCCFRGQLLREIGFDARLRGAGNVTHWEMHLCFAFLRHGYRLIYDPSIWLDHHVAVRHDGDVNARGGFERLSFEDSVFNYYLAMIEHLPPARRLVFRIWQASIGTRSEPGWLQLPRLVARGGKPSEVWERYRATRSGISMAKRTVKETAQVNKPVMMSR